jgi:hypothetical protein
MMPQDIASRSVRVRIPASVANDLDAFQKSIGIVVDRLGCPACCSGFDIHFQIERDWLVNENLELVPRAGKGRFRIGPDITASGVLEDVPARAVSATLAPKVANDLKAIQQAVAKIADQLGCSACCSGFDIAFLREREFILDQALNIRGGA